MSLATIAEAVTALADGRPVIVVDDEDRENEGDVVLAAELVTAETIAWTVRNSSGFLCAPLAAELADALDLPPMVAVNQDPRGTAYTVTVDAAEGISTGISAADRARTLRVLADPASVPSDLRRPGHVVPLRGRPGGVLERAGHTEAALDLLAMAGLRPAAVIGEIVGEDGSMARLPELLALSARESVPVVTIADLVALRREDEHRALPREDEHRALPREAAGAGQDARQLDRTDGAAA